MSSFDIAGGLRNLKGGPLDTLRGPYVSLTAANLAIPNVLVDGVNFREGKQVDIVDSEGIYITYWWQQGYEDENLTPVLIKGDKGDPFVYSDFTPEQITDLKQPAIDAAVVANTAASNANDKATLANNAAINADNKANLANTATNNANTATTNANNAATNANDKAALAQTAATNANNATSNANTAISQANTARDNANTAASSANTATTNANTATSAANTATSNANTATSQANIARDNAISATEDAIEATNNAVAATNNANTATTNAIAAASLAENAKGWTPIFIDINDGARIVRKLNDYTGGTGTKPNVNVGKYLKSDGTYTAVISEAIDYKGSTAAGVTTGVIISFQNDRFYGSVITPETGNITANTTDAQLGITNVIIHNSATAPTFSSQFKKLSGSGNYLVNNVNYIFCTYVTDNEIIYIISQRL